MYVSNQRRYTEVLIVVVVVVHLRRYIIGFVVVVLCSLEVVEYLKQLQ